MPGSTQIIHLFKVSHRPTDRSTDLLNQPNQGKQCLLAVGLFGSVNFAEIGFHRTNSIGMCRAGTVTGISGSIGLMMKRDIKFAADVN